MSTRARGALLAFGAHKGSGLAIMCEVLGGAVTGGADHRPAPRAQGRHRQQHALLHPRPCRARRSGAHRRARPRRWATGSRPRRRRRASPRSCCRASPSGAPAQRRLAEGVPIDDKSLADILAAVAQPGRQPRPSSTARSAAEPAHGARRLRRRRRRRGGPRLRAPPGHGRARGDRAGAGGRHRHRDQLAQQRGDPRRHLLRRRQPEGAALHRRQAVPLPLLRRARRGARPLRQADRRHRRGASWPTLATIRANAAGLGHAGPGALDGRAGDARWSRRCAAPAPCGRPPPASSTATG